MGKSQILAEKELWGEWEGERMLGTCGVRRIAFVTHFAFAHKFTIV
jgi:hypothetical protein